MKTAVQYMAEAYVKTFGYPMDEAITRAENSPSALAAIEAAMDDVWERCLSSLTGDPEAYYAIYDERKADE